MPAREHHLGLAGYALGLVEAPWRAASRAMLARASTRFSGVWRVRWQCEDGARPRPTAPCWCDQSLPVAGAIAVCAAGVECDQLLGPTNDIGRAACFIRAQDQLHHDRGSNRIWTGRRNRKCPFIGFDGFHVSVRSIEQLALGLVAEDLAVRTRQNLRRPLAL